MSRSDIKNHINVAQTLRPAARTASANGLDVDLANFDAATVIIDAGTWTDGSHTFEVQHADDNGSGAPDTYAAVDAADLDGTEPVVDGATDDDQIYEIGYRGIKRWLRVIVTVAGAPATGAVYAATVVRGKGRVKP